MGTEHFFRFAWSRGRKKYFFSKQENLLFFFLIYLTYLMLFTEQLLPLFNIISYNIGRYI